MPTTQLRGGLSCARTLQLALWRACSDGCRSSGTRGRSALYLVADGGGYLCAEQLDGAHHLLVRQRTDADLRHKALVAEELVLEEYLLYDLLRAADHERSVGRATHLELPAAHRRPPTLAADPVHHRGVSRVVLVARLPGGLGHVGVRVDADRQPRRVVAGPVCGLAVEPGGGGEVLGLTADDRDRQREAEQRGTNDRLRSSPDGDPDRQRILERAWVDPGVLERRAVLARPRDALGIAHFQQQLEFLGEQLVVVAQVVTEQRERLDERAAAGHDLRAAVRDEIERGEVLEDAYGIVRAQNRDSARQANVPRAGRGRCQRHGRRRDGVVGAVVLADAEDVEAELIRQLDLLEEVVQPSCRVDLGADVGEGVEAQFHRLFLSGRVHCERTCER